jgi:hypothetical protein
LNTSVHAIHPGILINLQILQQVKDKAALACLTSSLTIKGGLRFFQANRLLIGNQVIFAGIW